MRHDSPRYWQDLTSPEAARLVDRDPVLILPLAAIEQHGPHLPLSTDLDIGTGLVTAAFRHLPEGFPAWVLPPQVVGASREHRRRAGTLSLGADLLATVIHRIGLGVAASGVRRLVLFSSHGGNRAAQEEAALRLRDDAGMLVLKVHYARFPPPPDVELPTAEWRDGLHGGAVETAMMLHLRPDVVRGREAPDEPPLGERLRADFRWMGPQGPAAFSWLAGDLGRDGIAGRPRLADAAMGERLVAHYGRILAEVVQEARAFPLDLLS